MMTKKNLIDKQLEIFARLTGGQMPYGLLSDVGKMVGVSRERVRQRAKAMGFLMSRDLKTKRPCYYCEKKFDRPQKKYCSSCCRKRYYFYKYQTISVCPGCALGFLHYKKNPPRFCSRTCRGRWVGRKYGWPKGVTRKHPLDRKILKRDLGEEFTILDFFKQYGYTQYNSAWNAVRNLVSLELVEPLDKKRGSKKLYRIAD